VGTVYSLKLFGKATLESSSGPLGGRAVQRRRLGLLALLAVPREGGARPAAGVSRDRLIAYLWPEADSERGRHLLSDSIYRINQALGGDAITTSRSLLQLDDALLTSDVAELEAAAARGDHRAVVSLYAGPFLDGVFLADSPEFERWVDATRARYARIYAAALEALAEETEQTEGPGRATEWWRVLAAHDPYDSRITLRLTQALDASGARAAALQHARLHAELLRAEFGTDPHPALVAFVEQMRSRVPGGVPSPGKGSPAIALPRELRLAGARGTTVAVLPFLNLSADPENEFFADGITEDVIAHLSKIRALKVISRGSVMPFKQRQRSAKEIGLALGATALLDGSVRRAGDRVRIVATLVDVESDEHLWAETYDRRLTDIFAIQTDVALHIAEALKGELSREEQTRVRRAPTTDLQAYQLFLKGRELLIRYTPDALAGAIEQFERAIGRDGSFALAYANLALAHSELAEHGAAVPEVAYERAAAAAQAALRLDPELGAAYCTLGHLKTVYELDWGGAEQAFQRALELNPSSADAHDLYGRLCAALERYDDAIALQQRAQELDPLAHRLDVVTTLLRAGRYDAAIRQAEDAVEVDPAHDRALATLGWAYFLSGRRADGLAALERAAAASPGDTLWHAQLGAALAMAGETDRARQVLAALEARARAAYVSPYHFAYVYAGLGDAERAMDWLERAVAERAGAAYGIKGSFIFSPLHPRPRFQALLRAMGLA
jgi:TolB-like protein/DNA-binding SARP family transcriptional activator